MAVEKKILLHKRDFRKLKLLTIDWQIGIVEKLRSIRLMIKKINNDRFSNIYETLKTLEISSEFIEHIIIIKFFFETNKFDKSYLSSEEICNLNLKNYFYSLRLYNVDYKYFINLIFPNK
tara:strand:- start:587 stop:946 length:360 start_codon:yes stop_codon:yes gene_type:complete